MGDAYEEFEEEEVCSVMRERRESSPGARRTRELASPSAPRRLPTAAKMIPRSGAHTDVNGGSGGRVLQQWSGKYVKKGPLDGHGYGVGAGLSYGHEDPEAAGGFGLGDDGEDEDGMVPPHEWIARKLARSQISSFSMCEGAGRTLKGKDLSYGGWNSVTRYGGTEKEREKKQTLMSTTAEKGLPLLSMGEMRNFYRCRLGAAACSCRC